MADRHDAWLPDHVEVTEDEEGGLWCEKCGEFQRADEQRLPRLDPVVQAAMERLIDIPF